MLKDALSDVIINMYILDPDDIVRDFHSILLYWKIVGAPQMNLPFPFRLCPSLASKVHSCALFNIVFPSLYLSTSSVSFHCALQDYLC